MTLWPSEADVQSTFVDLLRIHGWTIDSTADTASKAPGIDVIAYKRQRRLGAEVKGFPSVGYADPARAGERKRTSPNNQAKKWFGVAVLAAMTLRTKHPGWESLIVVPDNPRYQALWRDTGSSLRAAGVMLVLLNEAGDYTSETWRP